MGELRGLPIEKQKEILRGRIAARTVRNGHDTTAADLGGTPPKKLKSGNDKSAPASIIPTRNESLFVTRDNDSPTSANIRPKVHFATGVSQGTSYNRVDTSGPSNDIKTGSSSSGTQSIACPTSAGISSKAEATNNVPIRTKNVAATLPVTTNVYPVSHPGKKETRTLEHTNPEESSSVTSPTNHAYLDDRRKLKTSATSQVIPKSARAQRTEKEEDRTEPNIATKPQTEYLFTEKLVLPDWLKRRDSGVARDRELEVFLQKIKVSSKLALGCQEHEREKYHDEIRDYLHKYENLKVTAASIQRTRMLELSGLPQLFLIRKTGLAFPADIKADAKALFNKWAKQDFDPDIMRGLVVGASRSMKLDEKYHNRVSWKFFGAGDLVNGQWWPILLACLRDGAHGATEAGISRLGDEGAVSVLVSNSDYEDKDMGDEILYCGTRGHDHKMTDHTRALHNNIRTQKPVRVIRSAKLPKENHLRPELGYRYDGVYSVEGSEMLDAEKAHYRFRLVRQANQDPIRWRGKGARPTEQDMAAYRTHRMLTGTRS